MAAKWTDMTLEEVKSAAPNAIAIGPFGSRLKSETYTEEGVPVIRGTNISDTRCWKGDFVFVSDERADSLSTCVVTADDLVFPHRGAIGEVGIVPCDETPRYMLSTSMMKITCDPEKASPLFLFYYFRSARGRHEILRFASQVGTPGIGQPLTSLKSFRIPNTPIEIQRVIAHILGTLDDKIEHNRRTNRILEQIARTQFKSWFVDFDPVHAKAQGNWSPDNTLPGYPVKLFGLFPNSLSHSQEAKQIPTGWTLSTLADVATLNSESWSQETAPEQINYVDLANTKWGRIDSTTPYSWTDAPSRARRVLNSGDTIVGTVRPGNGSYALIMESGLTGSTGFACLRPLEPEFAEFVYLASTAQNNIDRLAHLADGAAYPAVRPDVVLATPIVRPTDDLLKEFSKITRPVLSAIASREKESRTLSQLRDTLLPKLLSGELEISNPERFGGRDK